MKEAGCGRKLFNRNSPSIFSGGTISSYSVSEYIILIFPQMYSVSSNDMEARTLVSNKKSPEFRKYMYFPLACLSPLFIPS